MSKKLTSLLIAILLVVSSVGVFAEEVIEPGTGSSEVHLEVAATRFSVTVPLNLPITVDAQGTVYTPSDAKIINESFGGVIITNVEITPAVDWEIVSYNTDMTMEKVGAKKLGFKINNSETVGNNILFEQSNFSRLDGANAYGTNELTILYDAVVPAQKTAIEAGTRVADVVFTIGWDE